MRASNGNLAKNLRTLVTWCFAWEFFSFLVLLFPGSSSQRFHGSLRALLLA